MMRARGAELVKWGFVCIATDYTHAGKGGGGRGDRDGIDFTQADARPENIRRGLACLEILCQQKDVDPKRIALYGHSMGVFLTIALAAAAPDKVAAAAITTGGVITADYRAAFRLQQGLTFPLHLVYDDGIACITMISLTTARGRPRHENTYAAQRAR